jgi:hypothetical protein
MQQHKHQEQQGSYHRGQEGQAAKHGLFFTRLHPHQVYDILGNSDHAFLLAGKTGKSQGGIENPREGLGVVGVSLVAVTTPRGPSSLARKLLRSGGYLCSVLSVSEDIWSWRQGPCFKPGIQSSSEVV